MQTSRTFKIQGFIDGVDRPITYTELTISQADSLWWNKWENASPFSMLQVALSEITDLTNKEFEMITLQDAIALLFYYRLKLYGEIPIDIKGNIPSNYIKKKVYSLQDKTTTIEINRQPFTPFIPLRRAIQAEEYALSTGRVSELKYFLLGAGFRNGSTIEGGLHILNSPTTNELKSELIAFNELIKEVSNINLSIYNGVGVYEDKTPDDTRVKILTTPASKGGNESVVALNFQQAFFLLLNAW